MFCIALNYLKGVQKQRVALPVNPAENYFNSTS